MINQGGMEDNTYRNAYMLSDVFVQVNEQVEVILLELENPGKGTDLGLGNSGVRRLYIAL